MCIFFIPDEIISVSSKVAETGSAPLSDNQLSSIPENPKVCHLCELSKQLEKYLDGCEILVLLFT